MGSVIFSWYLLNMTGFPFFSWFSILWYFLTWAFSFSAPQVSFPERPDLKTALLEDQPFSLRRYYSERVKKPDKPLGKHFKISSLLVFILGCFPFFLGISQEDEGQIIQHNVEVQPHRRLWLSIHHNRMARWLPGRIFLQLRIKYSLVRPRFLKKASKSAPPPDHFPTKIIKSVVGQPIGVFLIHCENLLAETTEKEK